MKRPSARNRSSADSSSSVRRFTRTSDRTRARSSSRSKRLGQDFVCACRQTADAEIVCVHRRHQHNRDQPRGFVPLQLSTDIEPADARHHDVEENGIRQLLGRDPNGVMAACRRVHGEVRHLQQLAQARERWLVVIDNEERPIVLHHGLPMATSSKRIPKSVAEVAGKRPLRRLVGAPAPVPNWRTEALEDTTVEHVTVIDEWPQALRGVRES